ncbi:hypothetical protein ACA910_001361 [Epithemia clementina (nom. ined.)]
MDRVTEEDGHVQADLPPLRYVDQQDESYPTNKKCVKDETSPTSQDSHQHQSSPKSRASEQQTPLPIENNSREEIAFADAGEECMSDAQTLCSDHRYHMRRHSIGSSYIIQPGKVPSGLSRSNSVDTIMSPPLLNENGQPCVEIINLVDADINMGEPDPILGGSPCGLFSACPRSPSRRKTSSRRDNHRRRSRGGTCSPHPFRASKLRGPDKAVPHCRGSEEIRGTDRPYDAYQQSASPSKQIAKTEPLTTNNNGNPMIDREAEITTSTAAEQQDVEITASASSAGSTSHASLIQDSELRALLQMTHNGSNASALFPAMSQDSDTDFISDDGIEDELGALGIYHAALQMELERAEQILKESGKLPKDLFDAEQPKGTRTFADAETPKTSNTNNRAQEFSPVVVDLMRDVLSAEHFGFEQGELRRDQDVQHREIMLGGEKCASAMRSENLNDRCSTNIFDHSTNEVGINKGFPYEKLSQKLEKMESSVTRLKMSMRAPSASPDRHRQHPNATLRGEVKCREKELVSYSPKAGTNDYPRVATVTNDGGDHSDQILGSSERKVTLRYSSPNQSGTNCVRSRDQQETLDTSGTQRMSPMKSGKGSGGRALKDIETNSEVESPIVYSGQSRARREFSPTVRQRQTRTKYNDTDLVQEAERNKNASRDSDALEKDDVSGLQILSAVRHYRGKDYVGEPPRELETSSGVESPIVDSRQCRARREFSPTVREKRYRTGYDLFDSVQANAKTQNSNGLRGTDLVEAKDVRGSKTESRVINDARENARAGVATRIMGKSSDFESPIVNKDQSRTFGTVAGSSRLGNTKTERRHQTGIDSWETKSRLQKLKAIVQSRENSQKLATRATNLEEDKEIGCATNNNDKSGSNDWESSSSGIGAQLDLMRSLLGKVQMGLIPKEMDTLSDFESPITESSRNRTHTTSISASNLLSEQDQVALIRGELRDEFDIESETSPARQQRAGTAPEDRNKSKPTVLRSSTIGEINGKNERVAASTNSSASMRAAVPNQASQDSSTRDFHPQLSVTRHILGKEYLNNQHSEGEYGHGGIKYWGAKSKGESRDSENAKEVIRIITPKQNEDPCDDLEQRKEIFPRRLDGQAIASGSDEKQNTAIISNQSDTHYYETGRNKEAVSKQMSPVKDKDALVNGHNNDSIPNQKECIEPASDETKRRARTTTGTRVFENKKEMVTLSYQNKLEAFRNVGHEECPRPKHFVCSRNEKSSEEESSQETSKISIVAPEHALPVEDKCEVLSPCTKLTERHGFLKPKGDRRPIRSQSMSPRFTPKAGLPPFSRRFRSRRNSLQYDRAARRAHFSTFGVKVNSAPNDAKGEHPQAGKFDDGLDKTQNHLPTPLANDPFNAMNEKCKELAVDQCDRSCNREKMGHVGGVKHGEMIPVIEGIGEITDLQTALEVIQRLRRELEAAERSHLPNPGTSKYTMSKSSTTTKPNVPDEDDDDDDGGVDIYLVTEKTPPNEASDGSSLEEDQLPREQNFVGRISSKLIAAKDRLLGKGEIKSVQNTSHKGGGMFQKKMNKCCGADSQYMSSAGKSQMMRYPANSLIECNDDDETIEVIATSMSSSSSLEIPKIQRKRSPNWPLYQTGNTDRRVRFAEGHEEFHFTTVESKGRRKKRVRTRSDDWFSKLENVIHVLEDMIDQFVHGTCPGLTNSNKHDSPRAEDLHKLFDSGCPYGFSWGGEHIASSDFVSSYTSTDDDSSKPRWRFLSKPKPRLSLEDEGIYSLGDGLHNNRFKRSLSF